MKLYRNKLIVISLLLGCCAQAKAQKLTPSEDFIDVVAGRSVSFTTRLNDAKPDAYNALTLNLQIAEGFYLAGNPIITDKWKNPLCITQENLILPDSIALRNYESILFYALGKMDKERNIKMAFASANELPGTSIDSLMTFIFRVSPEANLGTHAIKLQNILFEYDSIQQDRLPDANIRVRVCVLGDANHDNKILVNDATLIINHILGKTSTEEYNPMLADMNDDDEIDIFDVMKLVTVIVTGKMPVVDEAMARAVEKNNYEDLSVALYNNGITMGIPNAQRFTSFQFDIELPDDINLTDAKIIDKSTNHMIQYAKTDDHQYRVVGLSMNNSLLKNDPNGIIALEVPNYETIKISNAIFVDSQGQISYFNDKEINSGITGIKNISISDDESMYDLSGRKIKNENHHIHKGIYIINKKRVVIK